MLSSPLVVTLLVGASLQSLAGKLPSLRALSASVEALTQQVAPSVVQVIVTGFAPVDSASDGGIFVGRQRVVGSGAILSADGYIITNAHVIQGAEQVRVVLHQASGDDPVGQFLSGPPTKTVDARVVGSAAEVDLALLKVDETGLHPLPLADYHRVHQGELVFAFGSPQGLANSVTMGVVSAVARQPDPDNPTLYVQTDAPINPGNSGGPLVNADGQLVGVNTFILSQSGGSQGLGFAIPSAVVASTYPDLRDSGRIHRGIIGLSVQANSADYAGGLGLAKDSGPLVADVLPDGAADGAGVEIGDIVLAVGEHATPTIALFGLEMATYKPGDLLTMRLLRGDSSVNATMRVAEDTRPDPQLAKRADPSTHTIARLGIIGVDVNDEIAALEPKLRERSGVLVAARDAKSQGTGNPLTSGDIIHRVNQYSIRSLDGLRTILDGLSPGARAVVQVEHDGSLRFVLVRLDR
jgi:serine protease Do